MKQYAIPAILGLAIIAAGAFAFAPVGQATAVHQTIISTLEESIPLLIAANSAKVFESAAIEDINDGDTVTLTCEKDYLIQDITLDMGTFTDEANEEVDVAIDGDDVASEIDLVSDSAVGLLDGGVGAASTEATTVTFIIGTDSNDENLEKARFTVHTGGTCTVTTAAAAAS
ncbi:MAG: hypothetical protein IS860_11545 [Nitrosopumilus sp.]|nr:hypothetical protein [Nitrosopumilus sp.]